MSSNLSFSPLVQALLREFEKGEAVLSDDKKISVNPIVSRVASLYEKLRNVMDYRDEEVILRAAIERILKRRFLLGGSGKTIAGPLVRELVWARYFADETLSESIVERIQKELDLFLNLREQILEKHKTLKEKTVNEWIYQLMSSSIAHILGVMKRKEKMTNFMFEMIRSNISIVDDTEQVRDIQVFIAVHKAFAKDDLALLRYHLFTQYFGTLTEENVDKVADKFLDCYKEIYYQFHYPCKDKILNYVKDKSAVFFILEDLLNLENGKIGEFYDDEAKFKRIVNEICETRYAGIAARVRRAIIRSFFFILFTKTFFAIGVEATFDRLVYGGIAWPALVANIATPPILMVLMGLLIKTPAQDNTDRIHHYVRAIFTTNQLRFAKPLTLKKNPPKAKPVLNFAFTILWFATFFVAFGLIVYILSKIHFTILSIGVFVFFLAIASFLAYRINQSAKIYVVEPRKTLTAPIIDFMFIPVVTVGRSLTTGISQINIFIYIFDYIIEMPFKGLAAFLEQWFYFLQAKREGLE
jgi:hypothetical protein